VGSGNGMGFQMMRGRNAESSVVDGIAKGEAPFDSETGGVAGGEAPEGLLPAVHAAASTVADTRATPARTKLADRFWLVGSDMVPQEPTCP
jgi:hypothetical protein